MTNYAVLREFEQGLTQADLDDAVERSGAVIEEMRGEGTAISYLGSSVFTDEQGLAWATMCRYDADSEATVEDHSERSELPFSGVFRPGTSLEGIAPETGIRPKAA